MKIKSTTLTQTCGGTADAAGRLTSSHGRLRPISSFPRSWVFAGNGAAGQGSCSECEISTTFRDARHQSVCFFFPLLLLFFLHPPNLSFSLLLSPSLSVSLAEFTARASFLRSLLSAGGRVAAATCRLLGMRSPPRQTAELFPLTLICSPPAVLRHTLTHTHT